MMTQFTPYIETWMRHIRHLAEEIGPRGSTTEGERRGHVYCQEVLSELGFEPMWETYQSARSIYQPHLIAALAMLVAFALYPLAGRISAGLAALLAVVALVSELRELSFNDNLLRRIVPKAPSQNVVALIPPADEHRQDLVLVGHVDSHRTPLIFKSAGWLAAYRAFTTLAFIAFCALVLLYALGTFTQWGWIWPLSSIAAICAVLLAAMCLQADRTPFTHGANDNASAAGLVLTLAEHLRHQPLQHTRVWLALTGCEEVQQYGAIDFYRRHRSEFKNPKSLVFEMVGCAGPGWLMREGIIIPFYADRRLARLAEQVARQHPELEAYPVRITGGNTEAANSLRAGIPAICFIGLTRDGAAPYWHQAQDMVDKMNQDIMARNYAFAWHFIQALDQQAAEQS